MKNRILKYGFVLLIIFSVNLLGQNDLLYSRFDLLESIKNNYSKNEYILKINSIAENYLSREIKTITSVESPLGKEHLNEYFSEGPYWWPADDDLTKPYIRKDGQRNPDRFIAHKELINEMYQSFTSLALAAYFTNDKKYSAKAEQILQAWFIDGKTRMAPHLKNAQVIRNKEMIRGVGIIETHRFTGIIESIILMQKSKMINEEILEEFNSWLAEYYNWLTKSEWGIDEKERGNNHSSWWAAQSASIASYLNYDEDLKEYFNYGKSFLIDNQINQDCRQPLEEVRTLSFDYCVFNLNALSFLASALKNKNMDLFNYKNINECSLIDAAEYLNPFLTNPGNWKLQQIKPFKKEPKEFIALIGLKDNRMEFIELYKSLLLKKNDSSLNEIDPFVLLLNAQISIL